MRRKFNLDPCFSEDELDLFNVELGAIAVDFCDYIGKWGGGDVERISEPVWAEQGRCVVEGGVFDEQRGRSSDGCRRWRC